MGDFNFPDLDWSSLYGTSDSSRLFAEFIFNSNFHQHIHTPTHSGGSTLDLLFTQSPELVQNVTVHTSSPLLHVSSDHYLISFSISRSTHPSHSPNIHSPFYYDFASCDYCGLVDYLLDVDFSLYYSSVEIDYLWSSLKGIINDSIALYRISGNFCCN